MFNSRVLLLLLVVTWPRASSAEVLEGSITTLLSGRSDPRDGNIYTVVPLYQSLRLSVRDVRLSARASRYVDDVRLELQVWGSGQFGAPIKPDRIIGDVDVGYASARFFRRHVELRIGRQIVTGGAARFSHVDGGSLTFNWFGLRLNVYGGVPVVPRFGVKVGEAAVGTRVSYRVNFDTEGGVSFVQIQDLGRAARQDLGLDLRVRAHKAVTFTGFAVLSLLEHRWAEVDLAVWVHPASKVDIRVDYRRQSPDLWIPRSSIFSVFSQETRDEIGGSVDVRPHRRVTLLGDYHAIFDATGKGHRAGLRAMLSLGPTRELTLGAEERLLLLPTKGYYQTRLFAIYRILKTLVATLDVDAYLFDRPLNGRWYSFTGAASVGWDFARRWRSVVSAAGNMTPFQDRGFELMAKLVYNPTFQFREVHQ